MNASVEKRICDEPCLSRRHMLPAILPQMGPECLEIQGKWNLASRALWLF